MNQIKQRKFRKPSSTHHLRSIYPSCTPCPFLNELHHKAITDNEAAFLGIKRHTNWRNEAFRGYADYMATTEFKNATAHLEDIASKEEPRICVPRLCGGVVIVHCSPIILRSVVGKCCTLWNGKAHGTSLYFCCENC